MSLYFYIPGRTTAQFHTRANNADLVASSNTYCHCSSTQRTLMPFSLASFLTGEIKASKVVTF